MGDLSSRVIEKNTERKYLTTLTNSAEFGIVNQQDFFDKDITNLENIDTYYIVKNNDFIYNPRISNFARVGPINRNKLGYTGVVSPLYNVFRTKNINILYLEFYFKTSYWHRFIKMNGDSGARSDRISIRILDFERMPIPYPIQEEQTKIGLFLDKLNTTIALHQRKLEQLGLLKKAYLQQMFPDKEIKVPRLRFVNFNEDWELCKFEDILKSHPFKQYLAEPTEDGNFPVIQQGDKPIIGYSNGEPYEDFTHVTLFGDHTVSLFKPTKPFFVATDGVKILSVENFEGDYLFYVLEQYKPESQGYKRHFTILKNEKCFFTENKEEQIRIGNFLKKLDKTITLHQNETSTLEKLKASYLQKMFI